MPTAIVTGATGITGTAIVEALKASSEWTEIYALSRSQKPDAAHSKVKHATIDLQQSAEEMAKSLSHIPAGVTHVFFCAYLADPDEAEATRINGALLSNFLEALKQTGHIADLQRFILTCGLKQYGVHLGQPKNPMREDDSAKLFWLEQEDRPPNFYYAQQHILEKAVTGNSKWSWTVTYPQDVIGFARGNFMNLMTSLGLYCAVSKELEGSQLVFPGSRINYLAFNDWTSARYHADFCLWAASTQDAANQRFNVVNGDVQSWQDLWPRLASRYGCSIPADMFPSSKGEERGAYPGYESIVKELHARPPVAEVDAEMGLKGAFKPSKLYNQIDLTKWATRPEVVKAWERLRDRHGLEQAAWDKATWSFLNFLLGREYSCVSSMSKARKMGFNKYADTWDEFQHTLEALEGAKMLPSVTSIKGSQS